MKEARYQILVKDGRKIVERHDLSDYSTAMALLDRLEVAFFGIYTVEYKDTAPFMPKF